MPPKSDDSNEIEVTNSGDNEKTKLPFQQRMKYFITNGIKSLRIFIYNKENQSFFGNTPSSWVKISIYYAIFYVCLGLFYSGMVAVFGAIISRASPRYTYRNSELSYEGQVYIGLFKFRLRFKKSLYFFSSSQEWVSDQCLLSMILQLLFIMIQHHKMIQFHRWIIIE